MSRLKKFLIKVFIVLMFLAVVGAILFLLQYFFNLFDVQIAAIQKIFSEADSKVSSHIFNGLSAGTVGLLLVVSVFPVFMRGVNKKQYFVSLRRGVISAAVFYLSDSLYRWLGTINRFYMILTMVVVVIITFVLIEAISLSAKKEEEISFRTDVVAAVISGLIFGILLKLFLIGADLFKVLAN